jgi:DHA1 family bicyclomycin/chloramphenicol resistance-like MFS transporter
LSASSTARPAVRPLAGAGLILLLGTLTAIGPTAIDMYLPALPNIGREFAAPARDVQLTLAVYFVGLALGQLLYGPISDRMGRKGPMLFGLGLFTAASLGCALAPNIWVLVACRFLQALGGCAAIVVSRAIVRDAFPVQDAARVFSLMTLVMGVAPILAPLAGAGLLAVASWHVIFLAIAGFGTLTFALAAFGLPETRPATRRQAEAPASLAEDLRHLLKDRHFLGYSLAGGMAQAGMFTYIAGAPFVFIELHQLSATTFSWIFGINAMGLIVASQANAWLLKRRDPHGLLRRSVMAPGAFGLALTAAAATGAGGTWGLLVPLFGFVASLGFVQPNATAAALEQHGRRAGFASAVMGAMQFALAAIASAMIGRMHDASALPMALVMATCGMLAFFAHRFLATPPAAQRASLGSGSR